jgi:type IV secretion system protein VirD4
MSGHRSKVFFSGLDDPASVDYVTKVAGDVRVDQRTWSADARGTWRTISEHPEKEQLLPAHLVRQMPPQEAVLFHGTLPPVHLRAVRWWEDKQLRGLVATDAAGRPVPPTDLATCPLSNDPSPPPSDGDQAGGNEILAHLPRPKPQSAARERWREDTLQPNHNDQAVLPLDGEVSADEQEPRELNRVAGACDRCMTWVEVGGGEVIRFGRRPVLRCFPACRLKGPARASSAEPPNPA